MLFRSGMTALVDAQGNIVIPHIECAMTLWARTIGLIGCTSLASESGYWIEPCRGVHTWGMRFVLDVVYLGADGTVLRLFKRVPPWRLCPLLLEAHAVLELPAGSIAHYRICEGDHYFLR